MREELVRISNLYQADQDLDRAVAAIAAVHAAESDARAALRAACDRRDAQGTALATLHEQETANAREITVWTAARASTQRALDAGAGDWQTNERQLAAAAARIGALEDQGLQLLEAIEAGELAAQKAAREVTAAEAGHAASAQVRASTLPALEAARDAARGRRDVAAAELPSEYREPYADVRRRRRPALVNVFEGVCSSCSLRVPAMRVAEALDGRAVHTCPGCGGWILP